MKNKYKIVTILLFLAVLLPGAVAVAGFIPSDAAIAASGFGAFATMINTIINWFIGISVSVAAITFSVAGARMLLNPNNPAERQKAMGMFKKTVIGMLIVLGAWLIVHTIVSALVRGDTGALRFLGN